MDDRWRKATQTFERRKRKAKKESERSCTNVCVWGFRKFSVVFVVFERASAVREKTAGGAQTNGPTQKTSAKGGCGRARKIRKRP